MAKKKAAKKKKVTPKAKKAARTEAPKSKKATRAAAAPKAEKKAKRAAKEDGAPATKRRRIWLSVMITKDQISKTAAKLIKECDALEVTIADAGDTLRNKLGEVHKALGGATFEHPDRGPMTIMNRGDKTFWRAKPAGFAA